MQHQQSVGRRAAAGSQRYHVRSDPWSVLAGGDASTDQERSTWCLRFSSSECWTFQFCHRDSCPQCQTVQKTVEIKLCRSSSSGGWSRPSFGDGPQSAENRLEVAWLTPLRSWSDAVFHSFVHRQFHDRLNLIFHDFTVFFRIPSGWT